MDFINLFLSSRTPYTIFLYRVRVGIGGGLTGSVTLSVTIGVGTLFFNIIFPVFRGHS